MLDDSQKQQFDGAKESYKMLVEEYGFVRGTIKYYKILAGLE